MSKLFEKIMQNQINGFINDFLSPYLWGYRKDYNTQQAFLSLIEKCKSNLGNRGFGEAVLLDLSQTFGTVNYGF